MAFFPTIDHLFTFLEKIKSTGAQAVPVKTGMPAMTNTVFTNTVDLHVAATNFTTIIDDYANEVACRLIWDYSHSANDPVAEQANFFVNLNNGTLSLTDNEMGGQDSDIQNTLTVALDLKLQDGERVFLDAARSPVSRMVSGLREYKIINKITGKTRWLRVEKDILSSVINKTALLKTSFGLKSMGDEFKLYWLNKFRTAHDKVKEEVYAQLTDASKSYFHNISDSIGTFTRYDREVGYNLKSLDIQLEDTDFTKVGIIPLIHSPNIDDKLDPHIKKERLKLTREVEIIYRNNMRHVISTAAISKSSHGENLVPDTGHWARMTGGSSDQDKSLERELTGEINKALGDISTVLDWIRSSNDFNFQKINNPVIEYAVEKSLIKVDMYKNKFNETGKSLTNSQSLGIAT